MRQVVRLLLKKKTWADSTPLNHVYLFRQGMQVPSLLAILQGHRSEEIQIIFLVAIWAVSLQVHASDSLTDKLLLNPRKPSKFYSFADGYLLYTLC
jgi:hypothetical protein